MIQIIQLPVEIAPKLKANGFIETHEEDELPNVPAGTRCASQPLFRWRAGFAIPGDPFSATNRHWHFVCIHFTLRALPVARPAVTGIPTPLLARS